MMVHYPVDEVEARIACELHVTVKNISMKVALGLALPCPPEATYHGSQIPAGYARVGVDEVEPTCRSLEFDIPAGEGENTWRSGGWDHSLEKNNTSCFQ